MPLTKKNITNRLYLLSLFLVLISFFIVFKLVDLQISQGDYYINISENREFKNIEIPANRGNIYSDDGELLASSVPKYTIRFDAVAPTDRVFEQNINLLSTELSKHFDKSEQYFLEKLKRARMNKNRFVLIARNLGYQEFQKIKSFPLFELGGYKGGLIAEQLTERDYPIGGIAQRTVGYERYDDFGNSMRPGLDGAFGPKYLKGKSGSRFSQKIGQGQWKPVSDYNEVEPMDGYDLITTLNIEIQDAVHHALLRQLEFFEADHGTAVVMETSSGEIKAISNLGRTKNGKYYEKLNYAVGESHEPGSTFKLMALIRALEDKKIDTSQIVDTKNGILDFYGRKVRDAKKGGYGKISVAKAFEVSSNTALVQVINESYKDNPEKFVDGLFKMNLNQKLGLPIIGEGTPKFTHPEDKMNWDGLDLPWMAFGYGISLTPLQILTFYNAIANNGLMIKPRFIKEVRQYNQTIEKFEREVISESICSDETISIVKNMMKNVVEKKHGTAHNIYSEDISLAGKTGTCQTEYWKESGLYISSFVGYFPADKPKYSCVVVIHKPNKNKGYYGNIVAAPVFKEIAQKINSVTPLNEHYSFLEIEMKTSESMNNLVLNLNNEIMPDFSKHEMMDIISIVENSDYKIELIGVGEKMKQIKKPGSKLKKGEKIKFKLI